MSIGYYDNNQNCYIDYSTSQCTSLDAQGCGDYNGLTYNNGDVANGFFNSIPNSSYNNTYFINGSGTSLDNNGNGLWSGTYYIGGTGTNLDTCGNGSWNYIGYIDGSPNSNGWSTCAGAWFHSESGNQFYQLNGVDSNGNGWASNYGSGGGYFIGGNYASGLDSMGNGYIFFNNATNYYVGGVATSLDSNGNGYWNNIYYINGQTTTLDSNGNGSWNGSYYLNATQTTLDSNGNGTWNSIYYLSGSATSLDYNGNGYWNGTYYIGGQTTTLDSNGNGYWNSVYYLSGVNTTLDNNGSGYWNGQAYYNASPQSDGWNGYYYYISNQQTSLDSSGSGSWNGNTYVNGQMVVIGTIFDGGSSSDWGDINNWRGGTLDNPIQAGALPDGNSPIFVRAIINANSTGSIPTVPSITVIANGELQNVGMVFTATDTILFQNGAKCGPNVTLYASKIIFKDTSFLYGAGITINGDVEFHDNTYTNYDNIAGGSFTVNNGTVLFKDNASHTIALNGSATFTDNATMSGNQASISSTATFKGNSGNAVGIYYLVRQHGGGINGSSILGIV